MIILFFLYTFQYSELDMWKLSAWISYAAQSMGMLTHQKDRVIHSEHITYNLDFPGLFFNFFLRPCTGGSGGSDVPPLLGDKSYTFPI